MEAELKQWGNSLGIIVPAEKLRELGVDAGDLIEVEILPKKRADGFGMCKGAQSFKEEKEPHEEFW